MVHSTNTNNYKAQKLRGLKRKYEIIMQRGGKCEHCGYDKNIAALEFHHINPNEKEFQLDMRHFSNSNLETLQLELAKCKLLCANCHREEHNKDLNLSEIPRIIENCEKKSFSSPETDLICPACGKHFPKGTGKLYCSKECREKIKMQREKLKGYPSKQEVLEQYKLLGTWDKVAEHFGLTRRIIQRIRKKNS